MRDPIRRHGGFADLVGYELTGWSEDRAEICLDVADKHLNRSGVMHGGVLTTLIDTACGYAGCFVADPDRTRRALTLSLNCHFVGPINAGDRLFARASRTGGGRQIFFCTCEVHNQDGRLVGQGDGVFRYRRDPGPAPEAQ